jgi:hypothetical protein
MQLEITACDFKFKVTLCDLKVRVRDSLICSLESRRLNPVIAGPEGAVAIPTGCALGGRVSAIWLIFKPSARAHSR